MNNMNILTATISVKLCTATLTDIEYGGKVNPTILLPSPIFS